MIGDFLKKGARLGAATAKFIAREVRERMDTQRIDEPSDRAAAEAEAASTYAVQSIEPTALLKELDTTDGLVLLDCREMVEWEAGCIEGSIHIPYDDLEKRVGELDPAASTVVYCLHGMQSAEVAEWLQGRHGFNSVRVLDGGIVSWYADLDQQRIRVARAEEREH